MEYIVENKIFKLNNTAVTLGKFDGVHRGHRVLMDKILDKKKEGFKAAIFTFFQHPGTILNKDSNKTILTNPEREQYIEELGIDILVEFPFDKTVASMDSRDFIKDVIVDKMDAKFIVTGDDFAFGKNRQGNNDMLICSGQKYGFDVDICNKVYYKGECIRSTRIKKEIEAGNLKDANAMLGYVFFLTGEVVHGRKLGRTMDMPTININIEPNKILPPNGVYISTTRIDGVIYPGITNVGSKPTIDKDLEKNVETNLFDINMDLYGKEVKVMLHEFIRGEEKFNSLEELKTQMLKDKKVGREYFGKL